MFLIVVLLAINIVDAQSSNSCLVVLEATDELITEASNRIWNTYFDAFSNRLPFIFRLDLDEVIINILVDLNNWNFQEQYSPLGEQKNKIASELLIRYKEIDLELSRADAAISAKQDLNDIFEDARQLSEDRHLEDTQLSQLSQENIGFLLESTTDVIVQQGICRYQTGFEGLEELLDYRLENPPVFFELGADIDRIASRVVVILNGAEGAQRKTGEFFEELYENQGYIVFRKQVLTRDQGIDFLEELYDNGITKVDEVLNVGHGWYDWSTPTNSFIYSYFYRPNGYRGPERPPHEKMQGRLDDAHALEYKSILGNKASMVEGADWNFIGCHTAWQNSGHHQIAGNDQASVAASYNRVFNGNGFGYSAYGEDIVYDKSSGDLGRILVPWTQSSTRWIHNNGVYTAGRNSDGSYVPGGKWKIPEDKVEELWEYVQGRGVQRFDNRV